MDDIWLSQSKDTEYWPDAVGYANYVKDNRNDSYLRFYVGQSKEVRRRIPFHLSSILKGKSDTLHYYICSRGGGHRSSSFIRLWILPPSPYNDKLVSESWYRLLHNILEMVFCRAFQSLPSRVLEKFFESPATGSYADVGLNVASPLLQSAVIDDVRKIQFTVDISKSQDPEVRQWVSVRQAQKPQWKNTLRHARESGAVLDCKGALRDALKGTADLVQIDSFAGGGEDIKPLHDLDDLFEDGEIESGKLLKEVVPFTRPLGSLLARIGFILDYGELRGDSSHGDAGLKLPWGFKETGFTPSNSLIWTFNFGQPSTVDIDMLHKLQASPWKKLLAKVHRKLIQGSALKVVFLCGTNARELTLDGVGSYQKFDLKLATHNYEIYLETCGEGQHRLYVYCPELPWTLAIGDWVTARRIDIIIKFAAALTKSEGIWRNVFERCGALVHVLRQAQYEAKTGVRMTTDTLDVNLKAWMYHKGFINDDDIRKVEQAAGCLTRGILMLLHVFPRSPHPNFTVLPQTTTGNHRKRDHDVAFQPEQFQEVRSIFDKVQQAKEARLSIYSSGGRNQLLSHASNQSPTSEDGEAKYVERMEPTRENLAISPTSKVEGDNQVVSI
jgi:hypothetical protein